MDGKLLAAGFPLLSFSLTFFVSTGSHLAFSFPSFSPLPYFFLSPVCAPLSLSLSLPHCVCVCVSLSHTHCVPPSVSVLVLSVSVLVSTSKMSEASSEVLELDENDALDTADGSGDHPVEDTAMDASDEEEEEEEEEEDEEEDEEDEEEEGDAGAKKKRSTGGGGGGKKKVGLSSSRP